MWMQTQGLFSSVVWLKQGLFSKSLSGLVRGQGHSIKGTRVLFRIQGGPLWRGSSPSYMVRDRERPWIGQSLQLPSSGLTAMVDMGHLMYPFPGLCELRYLARPNFTGVAQIQQIFIPNIWTGQGKTTVNRRGGLQWGPESGQEGLEDREWAQSSRRNLIQYWEKAEVFQELEQGV